jgi:Nucleotidyltransferase domain
MDGHAPEVARLLDRFAAAVRPVVDPVAVWAHGSLALGDYQIGRSDLDLLAVVDAEPGDAQRRELRRVHRELAAQMPLARKLHCSYMARDDLADPGHRHVTWAHERLFARPVTPVTRRELHTGGLTLSGPAPDALVPPVTDSELASFVRTDLREFWRPVADKLHPWLLDVWVDLAPLTLARAAVTLREGRLITKREALDVLPGLGAPAPVVSDIHTRRYGRPGPVPWRWRVRRARLTKDFVADGIDRVLAG